MGKNKTGKYIKYAIGEIILVVIGILIALQINNLNNQNKDNKLEEFYLLGIIEDIDRDLKTIRIAIQTDSIKAISSDYLLNHYKNPISNNDSLLLVNFTNSLPGSTLVKNEITFSDLKSSGRLNVIRKDSIRKSIQRYYMQIDIAIDIINFNTDLMFNNYVSKLFDGKFDMNSMANALSKNAGRNGFTEITPFNPDIFYKSKDEIEVKEIIDRLSFNIMLAQFNLRRFEVCRDLGLNLQSELKAYINKK